MTARVPKRRVYAGTSSEDRRRERRDRLLASALKLYGTQGYAHTSITELCKSARVTARHFYEEFDSQEALLRAVYDEVIEHARSSVAKALLQAASDPFSRVQAGIAAFVHAYLDDPRFVRIACIEVVGKSSALEAHRRGVIREFATIIESQANALAKHGALPRRNFALSGIALAGATNELLIEWALAKKKPSEKAIIEELVELCTSAIAGSRHK